MKTDEIEHRHRVNNLLKRAEDLEKRAPNKLDYLLALSPIPLFGEISAQKIVEYDLNGTVISDLLSGGTESIRIYDENSAQRFLAFRAAAYVAIPTIFTLGYVALENILS